LLSIDNLHPTNNNNNVKKFIFLPFSENPLSKTKRVVLDFKRVKEKSRIFEKEKKKLVTFFLGFEVFFLR